MVDVVTVLLHYESVMELRQVFHTIIKYTDAYYSSAIQH